MNSKTLGIFVIAVVIIGIGAYFLSTQKGLNASVPSTQEFTLKVINRKLVEGSGDLEAKQGDTVVIHITVDESEELHLHGYDKSVDLATDTPATLTLIANASGHFPFELEHSKTELGALDVLP